MTPRLPQNPMTITPVTFGRSLTLQIAKDKYARPKSWNRVQLLEQVSAELRDISDMDTFERSTDPQREEVKAFLLQVLEIAKNPS